MVKIVQPINSSSCRTNIDVRIYISVVKKAVKLTWDRYIQLCTTTETWCFWLNSITRWWLLESTRLELIRCTPCYGTGTRPPWARSCPSSVQGRVARSGTEGHRCRAVSETCMQTQLNHYNFTFTMWRHI